MARGRVAADLVGGRGGWFLAGAGAEVSRRSGGRSHLRRGRWAAGVRKETILQGNNVKAHLKKHSVRAGAKTRSSKTNMENKVQTKQNLCQN